MMKNTMKKNTILIMLVAATSLALSACNAKEDKNMTEQNMTEQNMTGNDMTNKDMTDKDMTDKDMTDKK